MRKFIFLLKLLKVIFEFFWYLPERIIYNDCLDWLKENDHYDKILGNLSQKEFLKRKKLTIKAISTLDVDFDYYENVTRPGLWIDIFDGLIFYSKTSDIFDERKEDCTIQTVFLLFMSGNYPPPGKTIISVEGYRNYISYRVFYRSDLENSLVNRPVEPKNLNTIPAGPKTIV